MEDLNKNFVILGDFCIKVANIRYIKFNVEKRTIQVCLMSNKKVSNDLIRSVGYNQQEIINNILKLYNKSRAIDFDPCYNIGMFYKNGVVKDPEIKSDINPLLPGVERLDVRQLPYVNQFNCIIFDPPFLVTSGKNGKIAGRYGSYASIGELKQFYIDSFQSLQRALTNRGLLIVKCQDFVNGRRNYFVIEYIFKLARELDFEILDLFILLSKTRPTKIQNQQHARKYHSYFLVLRKSRSS